MHAVMDIEKPLAFVQLVARRFSEERCFQAAGSLTFTTLFAIVPIVTVALTLVSAFPVFSAMTAHVKLFLFSNLVPQSAGKMLAFYVTQFTENAARLTALGIVFLIVTALTLMLTIDHVFNTIWRVSRKRSMMHRILIYWGMLTIGPLLIGSSLSMTSWLLGRSSEVALHGVFFLKTLPALLTVSAMSLLYIIVPNAPVAKRHAFLGGMLAGIAFELMKIGFGWYITHFTTYKLVYGAFASIPVFLLWIYISWLIMISGALITACLPLYGQVPGRNFPGKHFHDAVKLLESLHTAHQEGRALRIEALREHTGLHFDEIASLLAVLAASGLASETQEGAWMLGKDANRILLSDIYRATVFDPIDVLPESLDKRLLESIDGALNIPLNVMNHGS